MVRFSCFNPHAHSTKSKKAVGHSVDVMQKNLQESSHIPATKAPAKTSCLSSSLLEAQAIAQVGGNIEHVKSSMSVERGWNPDEIKGEFSVMSYTSMHQAVVLKKSQSLGSGLCHQGQLLSDEDGADQEDCGDSLDHSVLRPCSSKDQETSPGSQQQGAPQSMLANICSDLVNESIFSIGDPRHSEERNTENSEPMLSANNAHQSGNQMTRFSHVMVKSCSSPQIGTSTFSSSKPLSHSRSCEDLHILDMRQKDGLNDNKVQTPVVLEEMEEYNMYKPEMNNYQNSVNDGHDCSEYSASAKGWVIPEMDELNMENCLHVQSHIEQLSDDLTSRDFKLKRIEDWVHELQHCSSLEETNNFLGIDDTSRSYSSAQNDGLSAAKAVEKSTPGMEAAKRYISSLSASASTAQLANHGLVVIPLLSAFVGLKVLNLSGNAIVRITAGALPRGLHALNLSKNNISVIEGLRELTRLRILDLSYNRILRIGHGLASCSSLKELYLAGNKIGEVEGLHRLLKLSVLDLRFNKISTSKCLDQLAANYNSLQAISLEGNPVQKNVGDDQLKKHLLGLLPRLVYVNRQPIKASTLKDSADRAVRLGINAHQFDRGLRSDSKALRKITRGASGLRASSSSTHVHKSPVVVSPKQSRARHVRLPPSGNKAPANHRHNYFDLGSELPNFRSELSIRKSRSEGNLGAL